MQHQQMIHHFLKQVSQIAAVGHCMNTSLSLLTLEDAYLTGVDFIQKFKIAKVS